MSALTDHAEAVSEREAAEWLNALGELAARGPLAGVADGLIIRFPAARFGKEARQAARGSPAGGLTDPGPRR